MLLIAVLMVLAMTVTVIAGLVIQKMGLVAGSSLLISGYLGAYFGQCKEVASKRTCGTAWHRIRWAWRHALDDEYAPEFTFRILEWGTLAVCGALVSGMLSK